MDRKTKKVIRLKISKLLDGKCQDCPIHKCDSCEVYKEIRFWADKIDMKNNSRTIVTSLTPQLYVQLRNEGKSVQEIAELHGLTYKQVTHKTSLWRKKGEFKVSDTKRRPPSTSKVSKEKYLFYKNKGLLDYEIAEVLKVSASTIYNKKRDWFNEKPKKMRKNSITKEIYLSLKSQKLSDLTIAVELGVNPSTVYYHKKSWGLVT